MAGKTAVKDAPAESTESTESTSTESTEAAETPKGGSRPRPTYVAEKVTDLPEDMKLPRGGSRPAPELIAALETAHGDPGEWYCVGTFQSPGGAKAMAKRMQLPASDERRIALPGPGEWEVDARRIAAPGNDPKARWSKLYAKFLG